MINYGLDEEQEDAIKWTLRNLNKAIEVTSFNISVMSYRISDDKNTIEELRKIYRRQMEQSMERLKELQTHKRIFEEMLGVTENKTPMYSDNEGNKPLK